MKKWLALLCLLATPAYSNNLNVFGGSNIGSDEAGLIAAEYVLPFVAEVGPFLEWSRNTGTPDNRYNLGLVARFPTPWFNFFVDTRAGYNWNTAPISIGSRNGFILEPGVGYRFVGKVFDLMPRIGFNAVTQNDDLPTVNLSIALAFVL
jgi:hypothetical protein